VKQWLAGGETLLIVEAFQTGSVKAERDRSHRHFLTFNKSDDAERVQDILTSLAWLQQQGGKDLKVSGLGKAAVWAKVAAAVAQVPIKATESVKFAGGDAEFETSCFVPGIQHAGGWKVVTLLTDGR
jgi:hypothetical protein